MSKHCVDVVIPLGNGSKHDNIELKYCLRSIETYLPDLGKVFVIGVKPSFIHNIIHIPCGDNPSISRKESNIFSKIMLAVHDKKVSDDFALFNDDHFLLQPWDKAYHHKGLLAEWIQKKSPSDPYRITLANTLAALGGGYNWDTHCPIVFNKTKFVGSVAMASWHLAYGFGIKTLYCAINRIQGDYYSDLKISKKFPLNTLQALIKDRPYFSVEDGGINQDLVSLLELLYPKKSRYEIN